MKENRKSNNLRKNLLRRKERDSKIAKSVIGVKNIKLKVVEERDASVEKQRGSIVE